VISFGSMEYFLVAKPRFPTRHCKKCPNRNYCGSQEAMKLKLDTRGVAELPKCLTREHYCLFTLEDTEGEFYFFSLNTEEYGSKLVVTGVRKAGFFKVLATSSIFFKATTIKCIASLLVATTTVSIAVVGFPAAVVLSIPAILSFIYYSELLFLPRGNKVENHYAFMKKYMKT